MPKNGIQGGVESSLAATGSSFRRFSACDSLRSLRQSPNRGLTGARQPRRPDRLSTATSSPGCTPSQPTPHKVRSAPTPRTDSDGTLPQSYHPLTDLLTRSVCLMAGGSSVYHRPTLLLGHVWSDIELPALSDEVSRVVAPVSSHTQWTTPRYPHQHVQRRIPLSLKSLTSPWRLSISACAMNTNFASFPLPFLISLASGSVVLRWVALLSFSPRKSPLGPSHSPFDSSSSSRLLKLFMLAAASISVPSTLKCSYDIRPRLSASYATSSNSFLPTL